MHVFVQKRTFLVSTCLGWLAMSSPAYAQQAGNTEVPPSDAPAAPATVPPTPVNAPAEDYGAPAEHAEPAGKDQMAFGVFLNPLYALFGRYELNLAFSPTHLVSLNVTGAYYDIKSSPLETKIVGGDVGAQFFLSGQKPMHGAYIYPRVLYYSASVSDSIESIKATLFGSAVTGGYQWNWQPFSLRLGGGIVYYKVSGQSDSSGPTVTLKGVYPMLDANIGFVF